MDSNLFLENMSSMQELLKHFGTTNDFAFTVPTGISGDKNSELGWMRMNMDGEVYCIIALCLCEYLILILKFKFKKLTEELLSSN